MRSGHRLWKKVGWIALACAGFLGAWSGTAFSSGVPTLPTVTVTVPTITVPTVPKLPVPPPPPPPSVPKTPSVPTPTVPSVPTPSVRGAVHTVTGTVNGVLGHGSSAPSTTTSGRPSAPESRAAPARTSATAAPVRAVRDWVSVGGPKSHRTTIVRFRLPHAAKLVFTLAELAPVCRRLETFRARGQGGVNRIPFQAQVGGHAVRPGTYELVARTPEGRIVLHRKLVIVRGGRPTARQLAAARRANTCGATASSVASESGTLAQGGAPASGKTTDARATGTGTGSGRTATPATGTHSTPASGGVLGAHVSLSPTPKKLPFLVLALAALALVLLALGALPRGAVPVAAAGALVARRRLELAIGGMGLLVAAVIAYLIA